MSVEKAAKAGAWSALDIVLRQGVGFGVSIVLARLLAPEDFGLMAMLSLFSSLSIALVQGGLTLALVQRQNTTHEEESTVFWCNLIAAVLFALVIVAIAPAVARFYGYPALRGLMLVAAAQVVISSIGAVHSAILTRNLQFDRLAATGVISALLSGAAGIAAAIAGWGVWALAVQLLVLAAFSNAALWLVSDWRPMPSFRLRSIGDLYRFGLGISLSSTLEVLYSQGFALLVGKLHGAYDLGLFNRAMSTQALPGTIFSAIISRVSLPLFSARKDEPEALQRGLRMALSLAMFLSLPVVAGLAILSDLILLCLFGEQWVPAARILTILALAGALLPFHVLNLQLLLALGRAGEFLHIEIKKKVVGVALVVAGSIFGIEGLAYALALGNIPVLMLNSAPTKRLIGYGTSAQLRDTTGVISAAAFMSVVVYGASLYVDLQPWAQLGFLTILGAMAYLGFCMVFRLRGFREAYELGKGLVPWNAFK